MVEKTRILVYDSGFGGLSILKACQRLSSRIIIDYAADFAFFPYGDKSDRCLAARLPALLEKISVIAKPDLIVLACNTATTLSLDMIRERLSIPVVGTVPAIKPASKRTRTGVIGLLATPATITRTYTDALISDFASQVRVIRNGSARLVEMAEAYLRGESLSAEALWREQAVFFRGSPPVDIIVLGCTHFPHIKTELYSAVNARGYEVAYVDPSEAIARHALNVADAIQKVEWRDNDVTCLCAKAYLTTAPNAIQKAILAKFGIHKSVFIPPL